jgi:large conductance mechanosensitive channel
MLSGFKQFIMRGNVIDLAVGVVIGGAFGEVVASLTKDLITPLIAVLVGKPGFSAIGVHIGETIFSLGNFLNAIVGFLLVAAAIYFFVVMPMNAVTARANKGQVPAVPTTKPCKECLSEIPIAARRCSHCAQPVA